MEYAEGMFILILTFPTSKFDPEKQSYCWRRLGQDPSQSYCHTLTVLRYICRLSRPSEFNAFLFRSFL